MSDSNDVWSVGRLLNWTAEWFAQKQVEGGRLAAELLLARALGCKKIELYTRFESVPSDPQRAAFRELARQAGNHVPIAYLLGHREFFSMEFEVSPAVLVPRPETEILVQRIVSICRGQPERIWQILDIGTGSGCIAIAIAKYAPNAQIVASDISPDALAVARRNSESHGVTDRVRMIEADGVHVADADRPADGFDIIVSNPPYISESIWPTLAPNVRDHEPQLALLGPGGDGLEMYRRFSADAADVLSREGVLITEIGAGQQQDVQAIFESAGNWRFIGQHRERTDPHVRALEFGRVAG